MTDWLKKADALTDMLDEKNPKKGKRERLMELSGQLGDIGVELSQLGYSPMSAYRAANEVSDIAQKMEAEGSIFDNPEYQRQDENIGESGDFDPAHILDSRPKSDFTNDPGPASATPGAPGTSVAPGTGLANGLFD